MFNPSLTVAPDLGPIDLRHLDGILRNLRGAEKAVADVTAGLAEACDRIAAAPDDVEARHRVRMTLLHLRGEAVAVAAQLAALGREEAP